MANQPNWMPVFSVIPTVKSFYAAHPNEKLVEKHKQDEQPQDQLRRVVTAYAAHPNEKLVEKHKQDEQPQDQLRRVGIAVAIPGGAYRITLHSLPLGRQLLIRPSKSGERIDDLTV